MASQNTQPSFLTPTALSTSSTPSTPDMPSPSSSFQLLDPALFSVCKGPILAPPNSCYDLDDVVTLCIVDGKKHKTYKALRKLLMWHSSYFASALDLEGGWFAGNEEQLHCEHSVFDAFSSWIFTGKLMERATHVTVIYDAFLPIETLVKIWLFADLRGIPAMGNAAIDMLHERSTTQWCFLRRIVRCVYKNTLAESKLRTYLVDLFKASGSLAIVEHDLGFYTKEFLCDVLPAIATRERALKRRELATLDRCQWHDHSGPGGKLRFEGRKDMSPSQVAQ